METHGVGSQWTKRLCLESALPPNLAGDLNSLFDKRKVAAGDNIYFECKTLLLRIHGAQPDDDFKLALNLQMIGKPSQTAQKMVALQPIFNNLSESADCSDNMQLKQTMGNALI